MHGSLSKQTDGRTDGRVGPESAFVHLHDNLIHAYIYGAAEPKVGELLTLIGMAPIYTYSISLPWREITYTKSSTSLHHTYIYTHIHTQQHLRPSLYSHILVIYILFYPILCPATSSLLIWFSNQAFRSRRSLPVSRWRFCVYPLYTPSHPIPAQAQAQAFPEPPPRSISMDDYRLDN
ncbi:hypothetical protein F4779DRAFT_486411 [Xylariaceae sp. FL0662B]|nr:hypothetical protein F4779DRAFT_486411 [Xylariaceae sp. FL0662B]